MNKRQFFIGEILVRYVFATENVVSAYKKVFHSRNLALKLKVQ